MIAPAWAEVTDEAEMRKALTTFFMAGNEVLFIENATRPFTSGVFAGAITDPEWIDRLLTTNRQVIVPVRNSWFATANQPTTSKEMARRTSRTRLIPSTEHPEDRPASDFKHADLPGWVKENRDRLMYALIVLVQNYLAKGKPQPKRVKPLGSFESWSMTIGGILEASGIPDFQGNRREFAEVADLETAPWRELIARWWEKYGGALIQSKDLFPIVEQIDGFPLRGKDERGLRTAFGTELRKWKDRVLAIAAEKTFIEVRVTLSSQKLQGAAQWHLVEVKADAS
jgi:hypothetical protein